jgi:hypothetical protein
MIIGVILSVILLGLIPASPPFYQWNMPPARQLATSPLQRREHHASSPPELPPYPSVSLTLSQETSD